MAKDKIDLPSGSGGLLRYTEETGSIFKLNPKLVIFICLGVAVLAILLTIFVPLS